MFGVLYRQIGDTFLRGALGPHEQTWLARVQAIDRSTLAEKLREMVAAYRQADGAALYCSTGVNMGGNGSLAFWLQEVINAVSGNLDRIGGTLVGRGIIDFPRFGKRFGVLTSTARSRVGGFAAVNDGFPGGLLADEILTPGDRQVRALVVTGGNPLLTMPNSERLRTAFEKLELLVCLEIQMSETASQADYVLPCTSPLQRPDLPFLFPLMLGLQRAPYLQATRAVVPPQGEQRDEASIYVDLARAAGAPIFGSRVAQRAFEVLRWRHGRKHPGGQPALPQEQLLDLLLRLSGNQGFSRLHDARHGRLRAPHAGEDFLGSRVTTDDGKVNLAPAPLLQQARERLEVDYASELSRKDQLKLITRRAVTTHNSWTHNHAPFVAGDRGTAPELPVTAMSARARVLTFVAGGMAVALWALALRRWTDAVMPWRDAFIAVFGIVAQVLPPTLLRELLIEARLLDAADGLESAVGSCLGTCKVGTVRHDKTII